MDIIIWLSLCRTHSSGRFTASNDVYPLKNRPSQMLKLHSLLKVLDLVSPTSTHILSPLLRR